MGNGKEESETKRENILQKAKYIFYEKGFSRTTMADIANASGCQQGNLYHYFDSKEQILFEILLNASMMVESVITRIVEDNTLNPVDQLRRILDAHVAQAVGDLESAVLFYENEFRRVTPTHRKQLKGLRKRYTDLMIKVIRRGIDGGYFAARDEKLVVFMIAAMVTRMRLWFTPQGTYSARDVADFIFDFTLNGITCR